MVLAIALQGVTSLQSSDDTLRPTVASIYSSLRYFALLVLNNRPQN
ncbi:MAG: hypothetical protein AAFO84_02580 [Cyanobacteria bacterium J06598_1]